MITSALVAALTLTGLTVAGVAVKLMRDVAALTPNPPIRRAWWVLIGTIILCIALQFTALLSKLRYTADLGDVLAACVHLLGPAFVLAAAWLARRTARDILRMAELERVVLLDPLTHLPNRRSFEARLADEIPRRRADRLPLHLVMLDIDHFKQVNDTFGHAAGDRVLQQVAAAIRGAIPDSDHVCRIGGEEFAIILSGPTGHTSLRTMERVRAAIAQTICLLPDGGTTRVTASLGAATLTPDATAETMFARADAALYAAKRAGRNCASLAA